MKKIAGFIVVLMLITCLFVSELYGSDKEEIKRVIEQSYFNGAFNELDTESMRKGFLKAFAIFYPDGDVGRSVDTKI